MGNNWSFESQAPYRNNSLSRRYRSRDRQDRGYGRRRSNSMLRGREPIQRMWARKNSIEGQNANRGFNWAQGDRVNHNLGHSQDHRGRAEAADQPAAQSNFANADGREHTYDDPTKLR
ncbi:hypothetical protein HPP92_006831 [Vanilla planifolia]|uniref:Uncharacterized protein n=1 Tax=Vanilla planifolia TaxID=51239 RepID=A0A835VA19_VANPL|nr:hypothetical protein HPP92_006831 [Vanilla planifolia]